MNRPRWQMVILILAVGLAGASAGFAIWMSTQSAGPGEVSVVLHGAFIVIAALAALVLCAIALWIFLWRIRWLRWLGFAAIGIGILALLFGRDVQYWLIDMRVAEMDRQSEARMQVEVDFYEQMRGFMDDKDAALAVLPSYMERINARDIYDGEYTEDWNGFAYVHTIYAWVFFEDLRSGQYNNQRPPYPGLYCLIFKEEFGWMIVTDDQRARVRIACPQYF